MSDFRLPDNSHRTAVIGRTGSGKTQFGAWALSHADFVTQPWVIIDFKRDKLLRSIPFSVPITGDEIPEKAGVYRIDSDIDSVEYLDSFFRKVLDHENVGLFIDETYPIGKNSKPFNMILTQGRSKNIPMICLTQRPSWISRYVFSESDFFSVFHLNMRDDEKTVESMTPLDLERPLPQYHSRWHDVAQNKSFDLLPVDHHDTIISRFQEKLALLNTEKTAELKAKTKFI